MIQIVPTLFATTREALRERVDKLLHSGAFEGAWIQLDLMDNKFVANKSVDLKVFQEFDLPYKKEAQLMVVDPQKWIGDLVFMKVDRIVFPLEDVVDHNMLIERIKSEGIEVGLSLNPETPIEKVAPFVEKLDVILLMSVTPGAEGQSFHPEIIEKIRYIKSKGWNPLVGVDGGIKDENVADLVAAGADYLAIGSFLFEGDIDENVEKIWEKIQT